VAEEFDQDERLEVVTRRRPGRAWVVVFFLWFLVAAGAAAGYLWLDYDGLISALPTQRTDAPPAIAPEVSASLRDLRSSQQQTAREIETIQQTLATQQADLNRISEQLSALASRLDAVQSAPPLRSTLTPPQPGARTQAVESQGKKPARTSKPAGPLSIGGAPLNSTAEPDGR
jgi:uncharacterized coiled-coil protein SlyX